MEEKIVFVYNAQSDAKSKWIDFAHKMLKPETYACHLCAITHGAIRERAAWKRFRLASQTPLDFLYKDQFLKQYRSKWLPAYDFPAVFVENTRVGGLDLVISSKELSQMNTPEELVERVSEILNATTSD